MTLRERWRRFVHRGGSTRPKRVEIYGKRDCGLCDELKATLLRVRRDVPFELIEIDIESTPELYETYRERIPLVVIDGRLAFKYRADEPAVRRRLARS